MLHSEQLFSPPGHACSTSAFLCGENAYSNLALCLPSSSGKSQSATLVAAPSKPNVAEDGGKLRLRQLMKTPNKSQERKSCLGKYFNSVFYGNAINDWNDTSRKSETGGQNPRSIRSAKGD